MAGRLRKAVQYVAATLSLGSVLYAAQWLNDYLKDEYAIRFRTEIAESGSRKYTRVLVSNLGGHDSKVTLYFQPGSSRLSDIEFADLTQQWTIFSLQQSLQLVSQKQRGPAPDIVLDVWAKKTGSDIILPGGKLDGKEPVSVQLLIEPGTGSLLSFVTTGGSSDQRLDVLAGLPSKKAREIAPTPKRPLSP